MAEYKTEITYLVACPICKSTDVKRDGKQSGEQRYRCKPCQRKFRANGKAPGRKMDAELMGSAIQDFFTGKSYKQIAEGLSKEYDIPEPSKATIFEWVRDYSELAVNRMDGVEIQPGNHWVADEMSVDVGGGKAWLWNVMDGKTRYILATHLTRSRDAGAARAVLRKALATAGEPPDAFFSDKLRSYQPALRDVLPKTKHYQSEGLAAEINNNLSERLQGTFRDRIKTLRGLDTIESGQGYLDGWTLNYNLFRKHQSLRNRTPGQAAKVVAPYTEWADVVRAGKTTEAVVTDTGPVVRTPVVVSPAVVEVAAVAFPKVPRQKARTARPTRLPKSRKPPKKPAWVRPGEMTGKRRKAAK